MNQHQVQPLDSKFEHRHVPLSIARQGLQRDLRELLGHEIYDLLIFNSKMAAVVPRAIEEANPS